MKKALILAVLLMSFAIPFHTVYAQPQTTPLPVWDVLNPSDLRDQISNSIGLNIGTNTGPVTLGIIVSALLPYLLGFAGMILLLMLVWGGFEILMGAQETKSQEAGKQRITAALKGFLILFSAIWIGQLIEYVFGINIFKN